VLAACAPQARGEVRVGTTTTVQDSGLLDVLVADFEKRTGWRARASVQGTGAVLAVARRGDVDVVLVHEPAQELAFMREGFGRRRELVMFNDFILVGPPGDPAAAKGKSVEEAFRAIAGARATFVSRGDRSGTDVAEKAAWQRTGLAPSSPWYLESGVGQAQSLIVASERKAYMLSDRGTFFGRRNALALEVMVEPSPRLLNLYHVIALDTAKVPAANAKAADAWVEYVLSPDAQRLIAEFGKDRFGVALFEAAAGKREQDLR
jgi:tungstate transport system substrate-binding protein